MTTRKKYYRRIREWKSRYISFVNKTREYIIAAVERLLTKYKKVTVTKLIPVGCLYKGIIK